MTVVWLGVLLALGEAGTAAAQLLLTLSWWRYRRRRERWAFYCSLLPVLNVLVAGLWAMPTH